MEKYRMLGNSIYFFDHVVAEVARRERDHMVVELGQRAFRAPVDFIRWGIQDFRRYRRPVGR